MAVAFNVNGAGFKGASVPGVEAGLHGVWHNGKPYRANHLSIRALLPFKWRKAFDREGFFWWSDETPNGAYCPVHDLRGRLLTTIYVWGVVG